MPRDYLMFERAHEFDEQDRRLGMAEVYVERNGREWSCYGHMEAVELLNDRLRVQFDERGAQSMAGQREIEVTLEMTQERLEAVRAGLRRCFEGFSYYVDRSGG